MKPTHIVIHHSTNPHNQDLSKAAEIINRSHQQRGFPKSSLGFYIGYHVIIDSKGNYAQYRRYDEIGSHCSAQNMNSKSIGVCLNGNFENDKLEGKQLESLVSILKVLVNQYKIPRANLGYHRMYGSTACPGKNVINMFNQILDMVYNDNLTDWEKNALTWAKEAGVIVDPSYAVSIGLTLKQVAWFAEIMKKLTIYIVKTIKK